MRVELLGGLEVRDDEERDIVVTGAKLRALLVLLALQAGRVVSAEQLIDALWGEDPPAGVRNGLQALVSKLRRALGDPEIVAMRGSGYALDVAEESVDVHRFEALVRRGRAAITDGDREAAVASLAEADGLWRGSALADFAYDDFALPVISQLSELRVAAVEERIELELELGRHQRVIAALEALVAEHPLRERLRELLMVALYRAGRQADALRTFQEGRTILAEELGLEPGPELRRLEAAVLAQDPALDEDAAPVASDSAAYHWNVPAALTPLIGREQELRDLTGLFLEHRLLTLVGPGGVGKTRLALDIARAEQQAMANGAAVVELAAIGDPGGVRSAIGGALELSDATRMAEVIADRQLLIVLDNCEHVIDAAAAVVQELLEKCPRLQVLATSREALRIAGECVWPVPPLPPDDAAQLFVDRAHAAGARFEVSDDLRPVIADICARLDGLPLAIELAAARARAFPLQQLAARLDDRFRLLTGGSRTALPRQQALRAVVDWSYDLLFDDQRRVFERLSVFPGGCTLASASIVCSDDDVAAEDVGDLIEALVDKSLVIAQRHGDDVRFVQLQTLAHYGREKLTERGDATEVRARMATHCADLCAESIAAFTGLQQFEWLASVAAEHDNLRAALEWAIDTGDAETALGIAGALAWPQWLSGRVLEGKRWLDDAFGCRGDASPSTRALALFGRGFLGFLAGAGEHGDADLEEAIAIFRALDDTRALSVTLGFTAEVAMARGDLDRARDLRTAAIALHDALPDDDPFNVASRAYSRAVLAMNNGDHLTAEMHYRDAEARYADAGNGVMQAVCLGMLASFDAGRDELAKASEELERAIRLNEERGLVGYMGVLLGRLGVMRMAAGEFDAARVANARSLELGRRLMDLPVLGVALSSTARLALRLGRLDEAAHAATEAIEIYRSGASGPSPGRRNLAFDVPAGAAASHAVLGFVAELNGDGDEAERQHREGLGYARLTREPRATAVALEGLAGAAGVRGDGVRAAQLLGCAAELRGTSNLSSGDFERHDQERLHAKTTALLGHDAFVVAFEQGRRMVGEIDDVIGVSSPLP